MKVFPVSTLTREPSDPKNFTGDGSLRRINGAIDDPAVNIYRVEFAPEARTNWHTHSGHQLLLVVDGICRFQKWGEPILEVGAGDTIVIEPDEKHWHGAGPDSAMTHLALNVNAVTHWLDKVTEEEYAR